MALLLAPGTIDAAGPQRGGERGAKPAGKHAKLDKALREALEAGDRGLKRVIIRTKKGASGTVRDALEQYGDEVKGEHLSVDGVTAVVAGDVLEILANASIIESVSIDAVVTASGGPREKRNRRWSRDTASADPTSDVVNLLQATLGLPVRDLTGAGIGVALIDSGIARSRDFEGRITARHDFTDGGFSEGHGDGYGHGTHVAGLIGASGVTSKFRCQGIAPGVRFVGLQVLDRDGSGRTSDVTRAIEFAVANQARLGIDIINLSLGHPILEPAATDPLVPAVEHAVRAGIVVVASAGNLGTNPETGEPGYAGITSPGNAPSAITVGASNMNETVTRTDDQVAPFSSRGPTWYDGLAKPDLVAPGQNLVSNGPYNSKLYRTYQKIRVGAQHMKLSGSSMAAGVTTGVVALVLEASHTRSSHGDVAPSLTPNAVKAILEYTALPLQDERGGDYDWLTQGAGGLNAAGALALAGAIDTTVPVGLSWIVGPYEPSSTIGTETYPWASNIVWGN